MSTSYKLIPADLPIICSRGNTFKMQVQVKLSDGSFPNLSSYQVFGTLTGKNDLITIDLTDSTYVTGLIVCKLEKKVTIELKEEEYEFRLWWIDSAGEELHLIGGIYESWASWRGRKNTLNNVELTVASLNDTISLTVLGYTTVISGGGGGGVGVAFQQVLSGTINGSNATYTTPSSFVFGNIQVFVNGIAQRFTTDFTTSGSTTVIFAEAPEVGDYLSANYVLL